jgi:hypothetical protein
MLYEFIFEPAASAQGRLRVTGGKAHAEHKTSGLPLIATDARTSSIGGFGPRPAMAPS